MRRFQRDTGARKATAAAMAVSTARTSPAPYNPVRAGGPRPRAAAGAPLRKALPPLAESAEDGLPADRREEDGHGHDGEKDEDRGAGELGEAEGHRGRQRKGREDARPLRSEERRGGKE